MPEGLVNAELYGSGIITNIGVLHEDRHKEPWIIAMNVAPSEYRVLDYGMRWSIEAMFSDFKTRGFGITQSQIKKPDRLARLVLVLAIAMYWPCTGPSQQEPQKNSTSRNAAKKGDSKDPAVPMLALQSRTPQHPKVSRWLRQNTQALGGLDKLKGGKEI